jgi:Prenyltransferase and squalene oxidase repeat
MNPQKRHIHNLAHEYLLSQQQNDGSFLSHSSTQPYVFDNAYTYTTVFQNALILDCLADAPNTSRITTELSRYLAGQQQTNGSFNYWDKNSEEYTSLPYPNDMDDTCCALLGLAKNNSAAIDGKQLAFTTMLLLQTEAQPGGPYKTWLALSKTNSVWDDVDIAVNANIYRFLQSQNIKQTKLQSFLEKAITERRLYSPYYFSVYPVLYFLAESFGQSSDLLAFAKDLVKVQTPRSPLEHALIICAFNQLGSPADAETFVTMLIESQNPDGSWSASAFCVDPKRNHQKYYSGSPTLTTAFALKALSVTHTSKNTTLVEQNTNQAIHDVLTFIRSDNTISPIIDDDLSKIATGQHAPEIIASAVLFYESLAQKRSINNTTLITIATANTLGWISYTIYDDLIDDESTPNKLPVANIAHRKSLLLFYESSAVGYLRTLTTDTFNTIDTSNLWELSNCRAKVQSQYIHIPKKLPNFRDKSVIAGKSLGHALPFLLIYSLANNCSSPQAIADLRQAFIHYLIARQLHDDLHDWREDLRRGHLSYVVCTLLGQGTYSGRQDVSRLVDGLTNTYWHVVFPSMCKEILEHLQKTRVLLASMCLDTSYIMTLVSQLEEKTRRARTTQKNNLLFLKTYRELT